MIFIQEAILHVYDASSIQAIYSQKTLDLKEVLVYKYIESHIERALKDYNAKEGFFVQGAILPEKCRSFLNKEMDFIAFSQFLAGLLFEQLAYAQEEDSRDVIVCHYKDVAECDHIAFLVCRNKTGYTHHVVMDGNQAETRLVKHSSNLPTETQRLEAYGLIDLENLSIRLFDRKIKIEGEKVAFLEELVFNCTSAPSTSQNYKSIQKMVRQVAEEFAQDETDCLVKTKSYLAENARVSDEVEPESVAKAVFTASTPMQTRFKQLAYDEDLPERVELSRDYVMKKAEMHKLKTESGIELQIPVEFLSDGNSVEFSRDENGNLNIILKNVGAIENK